MNQITPDPMSTEECPNVTDQEQIRERFQELLGDESRMRADTVQAVYLPENAAQVAGALGAIARENMTCVLSAGRTGITGAAAPIDADAIISMAGMHRFLGLGCEDGAYFARIEPGITLADLNRILDGKHVAGLDTASADEAMAAESYTAADDVKLWFPVDPTEATAHMGGIIANNASGARTFKYGAARKWVRGLSVILADGRKLNIRRGQVCAENLSFTLTRPDGEAAGITLPELTMPATKCTAGYFCKPDMDLVDLFIGSEGTLGAIVEIEIALARKPESTIGVLAVVKDEEHALRLVENARADRNLPLAALEYFDHDALSMLKAKKEEDGPGSHIPDIPSWDGAAVYLELDGTEDETETACEALEELLAGVGSSIDETWAAMEPDELEHQKLFRHSVPEAVNTFIGQRAAQTPGLHKVGTDMAVPDDKLRDAFAMYRTGLTNAGLQSVVFGHIGNNHVHVNILPQNLDELKRAKQLYTDWAKQVVNMGGAVAAEHGIGRIKKSMLEIQYPAEVLDTMRALRRAFDPAGILAPGVMI